MKSLRNKLFGFQRHRLFLPTLGVLFAIVAFGIFGFFLTPNESQNNPYAYEIAAAFLGTLLTITVTAMLLRHQTSSEVGKERSVKIFDTKLNIYMELLKCIEDILKDEILSDAELFQLQLMFQKVVFIAGPQVLAELPAFASVFAQIHPQTRLLPEEKDRILHAFGRLAAEVRADLNAPVGSQSNEVETEDVLAQIEAAFKKTPSQDGWAAQSQAFLASCDADDSGDDNLTDQAIYRDLFRNMEDNSHIAFEPVGFTLRDNRKRILMHVHPVCSMPNKIFSHNLSPRARERVREWLSSKNQNAVSWHFRTRDLKGDLLDLMQIIQQAHEEFPPANNLIRGA